jgi:hypothetical protein
LAIHLGEVGPAASALEHAIEDAPTKASKPCAGTLAERLVDGGKLGSDRRGATPVGRRRAVIRVRQLAK